MADKVEPDPEIRCDHRWVQPVEGIWHKKHTCKLKRTKNKPHKGFHLCSCGQVD